MGRAAVLAVQLRGWRRSVGFCGIRQGVCVCGNVRISWSIECLDSIELNRVCELGVCVVLGVFVGATDRVVCIRAWARNVRVGYGVCLDKCDVEYISETIRKQRMLLCGSRVCLRALLSCRGCARRCCRCSEDHYIADIARVCEYRAERLDCGV